jgi:hypothetical protein
MTKICTLVVLGLFISCSTLDKMAVSTTADLAYKGAVDMEREKDWDSFERSALPNLKFLEGLLQSAPHNEKLLALLVKGYASYAFGVYETNHLAESFSSSSSTTNKLKAIHYYSKAWSYGLSFLKEKGILYADLIKNMNSDLGVKGLLEKELGNSSAEKDIVLFSAQALGGMINLQKNNMKIVASLPLVKSMFDWVCEKEPEINFGACQIFFGAFEAGRPKFLGGNPEKGQEIFLDAMKKFPENQLIKTAYFEYYAIPLSKEKEYKGIKLKLEEFYAKEEPLLRWDPSSAAQFEKDKENRLNLYNAIAKKRFDTIKKFEKDIF